MPHRFTHELRHQYDAVSSNASVHGSEYNADALDAPSWAMGPSHHTLLAQERARRSSKPSLLYVISEAGSDETVINVSVHDPTAQGIPSRRALKRRYECLRERVGQAERQIDKWKERREDGMALYTNAEVFKEQLMLLMSQVRELEDDCAVLGYASHESFPTTELLKLHTQLQNQARHIHDLQGVVSRAQEQALKDMRHGSDSNKKRRRK